MDKFFFIKHYLYSRRIWLAVGGFFLVFLWVIKVLFEEQTVLATYMLRGGLIFFVIGLALDGTLAYQAYRRYLIYGSPFYGSALEALLLSQKKEKEEHIGELEEEIQVKHSDLIDYFTLWAHQIKTPLAASRLLSNEVADASLRRSLEQELFKMDAYAQIVLQYLRLESFHEDLSVATVELEPLLRGVVKRYATFFIHQGLSLDLHDVEVSIVTDSKWLTVIIEQILSNSLKYTSKGGIEIFVADQTLHIRDTGLGIQKSDLKRVFERGFSGYNGHLTQQSSGLGLYLSKQIADKLGHSLTIESTVGVGTTVLIGLERKELLVE